MQQRHESPRATGAGNHMDDAAHNSMPYAAGDDSLQPAKNSDNQCASDGQHAEQSRECQRACRRRQLRGSSLCISSLRLGGGRLRLLHCGVSAGRADDVVRRAGLLWSVIGCSAGSRAKREGCDEEKEV